MSSTMRSAALGCMGEERVEVTYLTGSVAGQVVSTVTKEAVACVVSQLCVLESRKGAGHLLAV